MQLNPFKLERYFAQYEFAVEYLLCGSDCESRSIAELLSLEPGAEERFQTHWLGYTESNGAPGLREQIARIYTTIAPAQVLVHSGAEEAIFLFMQALLNPGDHVIVHWPCYQSLFEVARGLGCEVSLWKARAEQGWSLDLAELERELRPNTRAIVINTPHNPTGFLMKSEDYSHLVQIADDHGVVLFSDEVYRELEYDPSDRLPAGCDLSERAVSLGVMSKTYGLAGLRIGWIATRNAEIYERMASLKDYTTICSSAPSEFLAELALRHRQKLAERSLQIIRTNLELLDEFFAHRADRFTWQRPSAGPIAFPELLDGDAADFCDRLVKQAGVLLLPGTAYDYPGNHFRIGFGRQNMPMALERLEWFLDGQGLKS
jgi:aspartate/methionine/tyrosine aminotransferase